MMIRPVIRRLGLMPFLSLNRYSYFLIVRTSLGEADFRATLLDMLNKELKTQHPDLPEFRDLHLSTSLRSDEVKLLAVYQQEFESGENKYRRVTGSILKRAGSSQPQITFRVMDFSKHRIGLDTE